MADTGHALLAAIDAMTSDAYFRRAVLRHCGDIEASAATRFNAAIHPHDPMLVHSLREHRDAGAAFSQYFAIAQQQHAAAMQVMRAAFGGSASDLDVLDFACGHGRLLRFLALSVPPERIFASDLQAEAIAFVRDAFGVRVLPSHEDPQRFDPGRRFDFIWVASLFSHLPEPLFRAWLARLLALLTPRGVLAFSVRDAGLLSDATQAPDSGFVYLAHSENAELATDIYGTTYADEAYVREALRGDGGETRPYRRLRRALANEQDLYIVAGDHSRDLSALDNFRHGPWGWVDIRRLVAGTLHLEGWAASLDDGTVDRVEIEIDGKMHECSTTISRPDVAAAFGDPRLLQSGWTFRCDVGNDARGVRVTVGARTTRGEAVLLYTGDIRDVRGDSSR